ncbi:MAG: twin-arginine translocase subunit TatC [Candidatus Omnitrophica bacterium]|nr:twin-arginine translocase subunit TatC [Candidatus Omnitrophota bacterium]
MDHELTFVEHLSELRKRIIISLVCLGTASMLTLPFAGHVLKILKLPAEGSIVKLAYFSPQEAFLIYLRIGFLCGVILAFPVILYQFWSFVSPAIEERFKRYTSHFVLFCFTAFICGSAFAYFVLLPKAIKFLLSFGLDDLEPVISASKYISFVTSIILACGIVFQMPVLSFILTKAGLVNARMMRSKFKFAIVIIFIVAAVITPTVDAFNMLLLAAPMLLLYEVSIWISAAANPERRACSSTG